MVAAVLALEQQVALALLLRGVVLQMLVWVLVLAEQLCVCEGAGRELLLALVTWLDLRENDEEAWRQAGGVALSAHIGWFNFYARCAAKRQSKEHG